MARTHSWTVLAFQFSSPEPSTRLDCRSAEEGRSDKKYPDQREDDKSEMEAQYAEVKEDLIVELKEKTTTVTVKDFSSAGIKIDYNSEGEVKGRYIARHIETASVLIKPDGTSEYEARGIETTSDGDTILITGKGRGWVETPMKNRFEGENTFQTSSKKLAWLNNVKGRHEGTFNPATGEVTINLYGKT